MTPTAHGGPGLRVEVLGPLRLVVDGAPVEVPGPRRRAVLAVLALAGGKAVSVDELLDAAWPDGLPDSGRRALHSHVSRLRSHLGPYADRLAREGDAYRLALGDGELDAADARAGIDADDPRELRALLSLWRGAALEEFADVTPLAAEAVGLAELRLDLTDRWLEARLDAGGDAELVSDATRAASSAPLRERTLLVLARALAAEGRQAEAMRATHAFRRRLVEETGFDPTPAVDEVERAVAAGSLLRGEAPAPPPRLVAPPSPLVGREVEAGLLRHRLGEGRLVTVVGTGGVGKTRLTLEVAAELAAAGTETAVVDLTVATDADGAVEALAAAASVHAPSADAALGAARSVLAARGALVVLDNCEHLLADARALAAALLDAGPEVRILATSREPLGHPAEHLLRLGPLPVPDGVTDAARAPAFEAFVAHARRRDPAFAPTDDDVAAITEIVRRLDGLPLALELAAGRIGSLTVSDVRDRLGRALDVLGAAGRARGERHGTLRSTIDWSYRLLDADEQRLLRALALLPGGFDLACAEAVGEALGLDGDPAAAVAHLVDASVVVAEVVDGRGRYRLLETIRAFALDQLDAAGERPAAVAALVDWALALARGIGADAHGPNEPLASARLRTEIANLAAVRELADVGTQVALTLALGDLVNFARQQELSAWAIELAVRPDLDDHPDRATLLGLGGQGAWLRGELELAERLGTEAGARSSGREVDEGLAPLAVVALFRGDFAGAREMYTAAAATAPHPGAHYATASLAACYGGDHERAWDLLEQAFGAAERSGTPSHRAFACYARGELEAGTDDDAAVESYLEAIELARLAGVGFIEGTATVGLVSVWARQGKLGEALEGYRWLVDYWRRAGNWVQLWTTLRNLAGVLADAGDPHCALFVLAAADHAPEASLVDDATAAAHARLRARLDTELGANEARRVWNRAAALPRTTVVDEALEAVEVALGTA